MGEWRPTKAAAYSSDSMDAMKETLAEVIRQRLLSDPAAEAVVKACMKSCRPSNLRDFRNGDGALYGPTRLFQIAEALGLRPEITFRRHPNDKTQEPNRVAQKPLVLQTVRRPFDSVFTANVSVRDVHEPERGGSSLRRLRERDARAGGSVYGRGSMGPENHAEGRVVQYLTEGQAA